MPEMPDEILNPMEYEDWLWNKIREEVTEKVIIKVFLNGDENG